jgi:hypothetical protein
MERSAFLRSILFACAILSVSGCADILYTPTNSDLNDPDTSGCDQQTLEDNMVKSCRRLGDGSPVASAAPFFDVSRHTTISDPYKLSRKPSAAAQFFFELTPLGLFAPIFDYPPRETVYTGRVELANAPNNPASKFEFRVKAGETFTKTIVLDKPVTISIRCRPRGCTLSST